MMFQDLCQISIKSFQLLRDNDLATFSQGAVRHNLSVLKINFWSDTEHINMLCDTQSPRKLIPWLSQQSGQIRIPGWAVFLLNCPQLTQVQFFEQSQPRVSRHYWTVKCCLTVDFSLSIPWLE